MPTHIPVPIADYACDTGEGPLYHPDHRVIYWVDIPRGRLFRLNLDTGDHEIALESEPIGGFTLQADGTLLLFQARGAVRIWDGNRLRTVIEELPEEVETRFNDVIADPEGRVFCGTMPSPHRLGRLYRLDTNGTITKVLDDVGCSNGMGFTPDLRQMYFTDSGTREISRFDYDRQTGEISGRTLFVKTPEGEGVPDGMTVDSEGFVWSTRWDGGKVVRYSPQGEPVAEWSLPVRKVSSITFGGPDLRDIYMTTAGGHVKAQDGEHAGALFHMHSPVSGVPEFRSRVLLTSNEPT